MQPDTRPLAGMLGEAAMSSKQQKIYGRVTALFFMSIVMGFDLFFELFCARMPLAVYLIAAGLGALVGVQFAGWLAGEGGFRKALRGLAMVGCVMGLLGATLLSTVQPMWSSHCGFRYCGRTLGLSLGRSPFPVGTPSCRDLHMCANEYRFTDAEREDFYELIESSGCPAP